MSWQAPGKFCVSHKPLGVRADGEATWLYCHDGGKHKETEAASALDMDEGMICQGSLGDCYLLAALAAVVREDIISDDLIDEEFEDVGIYGVGRGCLEDGVWWCLEDGVGRCHSPCHSVSSPMPSPCRLCHMSGAQSHVGFAEKCHVGFAECHFGCTVLTEIQDSCIRKWSNVGTGSCGLR